MAKPVIPGGKRRRLNKKHLVLIPQDPDVPFGAITIYLWEHAGISILDAGGAKYYANADGTMTMEMNQVFTEDESGNKKRLSHTFTASEWDYEAE